MESPWGCWACRWHKGQAETHRGCDNQSLGICQQLEKELHCRERGRTRGHLEERGRGKEGVTERERGRRDLENRGMAAGQPVRGRIKIWGYQGEGSRDFWGREGEQGLGT